MNHWVGLLVILTIIFLVCLLIKVIPRKPKRKEVALPIVALPDTSEFNLLNEFPNSRYSSNADEFLKSEKNRALLVYPDELRYFVSKPHRVVLALYLPNNGKTSEEQSILEIFSKVREKNWNDKATIVPLLVVYDRYNNSNQPAIVLWDCKKPEPFQIDKQFYTELSTYNLIRFINRCYASCVSFQK